MTEIDSMEQYANWTKPQPETDTAKSQEEIDFDRDGYVPNEMRRAFEDTDDKRTQLRNLEKQLNSIYNTNMIIQIIRNGTNQDYANLTKDIENLQQQAVDLFDEVQQKAIEKEKELVSSEEAWHKTFRSENEYLERKAKNHMIKIDQQEREWKLIRDRVESLVNWFNTLPPLVTNLKDQYDQMVASGKHVYKEPQPF